MKHFYLATCLLFLVLIKKIHLKSKLSNTNVYTLANNHHNYLKNYDNLS